MAEDRSTRAALADSEYQQRAWTGDASAESVTGSLDACVRTLTNDTRVLPNPETAIGKILLAGDEIDRLVTLGSALRRFEYEPAACESSCWPAVVEAALNCLPDLVIASAWAGPDPDPCAPSQQ